MFEFLDYSAIEQHRSFSSSIEKGKYIDLLKKEITEINKLGIAGKASRLYRLKLEYPDDKISRRCVDFKFLESKAQAYTSDT